MAVLVQWYTIFSFGMVIFILYSSIEYFAVYAFLSDAVTESNLRKVYDESFDDLLILNITTFGEFRELLRVPVWIHAVNACSQLAGAAVVCIVVYQIWAFMIIPSYKAAQQNAVWKNHAWHPPKRVNWILWILVLPMVFCVETMRANAKVWGVITGKAPEFFFFKFSEAEKLEFLYAREDLEIASLMQFTAIYAFTRLVSSLFENTAIIKGHLDDGMAKLALEYKRLIRLGGFLGPWIYIAAGCLRATVTIVLAVILQFKVRKSNVVDPTVLFIENVEEAFKGVTSTAFVLLTVLSVVNMVTMTRTFIITDKLGDVNKKFIGARVMLNCSEIVPKVVEAFELGTPLYTQLLPVTNYVSCLHLNKAQAEMLKVAILNTACLATVIMNYFFWKDVDVEDAGLLEFPSNEQAQNMPDEQEVHDPLLCA